MTYETPGRKFDAGKARFDLIPMGALTEVARVLEYGARKYAEHNWIHVRPFRARYLAAAFRHLVAWAAGEATDPETGLSHLAHCVCCLLFLLSAEVGHDTSAEDIIPPPPRLPREVRDTVPSRGAVPPTPTCTEHE